MEYMELTGIYHRDIGTQQISDKFTRREFIVKMSRYTGENKEREEYIKLQLVQNRVQILDRFQIGDKIKVLFNLTGHEYVDKKTGQIKCITNLDAWRVEKYNTEIQQEK